MRQARKEVAVHFQHVPHLPLGLTPVLDAWSQDLVPLQGYPAGSDGPPETG
jgi:hypothetical protein